MIIRAPKGKERPYFSMRRDVAQNRELSFEARGMLVYLLSKPDDWEVKPTDLRQKCGRDKANRIINELIEAGHLVREQEQGADGKFEGVAYRVYEKPYTENPDAVQGKEPHTEKPYTGNPHLHNIESTEDREEQKREKDIAATPHPPPQQEQQPQTPQPAKPEKPEPKPGKRKTIPAAKMNPMKDAIMAAFGWTWDTVTKSERGTVYRAAAELCSAGVEPEQIASIYRYCANQGWTAFKPTALPNHVSNWRKTVKPRQPSREPDPHDVPLEQLIEQQLTTRTRFDDMPEMAS